jgi:hypothetical protein
MLLNAPSYLLKTHHVVSRFPFRMESFEIRPKYGYHGQADLCPTFKLRKGGRSTRIATRQWCPSWLISVDRQIAEGERSKGPHGALGAVESKQARG